MTRWISKHSTIDLESARCQNGRFAGAPGQVRRGGSSLEPPRAPLRPARRGVTPCAARGAPRGGARGGRDGRARGRARGGSHHDGRRGRCGGGDRHAHGIHLLTGKGEVGGDWGVWKRACFAGRGTSQCTASDACATPGDSSGLAAAGHPFGSVHAAWRRASRRAARVAPAGRPQACTTPSALKGVASARRRHGT